MPSQRPISSNAASATVEPGLGLRQDGVDGPLAAVRADDRPDAAGRHAPTSVSQQPTEPQRQATPSGLTGM